jgi:N-acetylglucosaminyldiphosphoundecaprenol N-acetyl-beta-D-mannosaminyltransferase
MQTVELLGIQVTGATIEDLHEQIRKSVATKSKWILANHNLHSLYLYHHDAKLRQFYSRAKLAHADGMSMIALARLLGHALAREQRVTYVDWIGPLMKEASEQGWRVFFVGGQPGVGEKARELLKSKFPGLELKVHHGYFDNRPANAENREVLALIDSFRPHVLMVGMGMPRQEHWIFDNLEQLNANSILPSGACMDFVAGAVPTPPRWMGKIGLEWFFRLITDPGRLWKRYLVEPWFVAKLVCCELIGNCVRANQK